MEDLKTKVEDIKTAAEHLTEHATDYVETYIKLALVNATQKATTIATASLTAIMLTLLGVFFMVFAGIGVAMWIGEATQNMKLGFFAVGGFFLLLALVFMAIRTKLVVPFVRDRIVGNVHEN
jgi:hypothetical protein